MYIQIKTKPSDSTSAGNMQEMYYVGSNEKEILSL